MVTHTYNLNAWETETGRCCWSLVNHCSQTGRPEAVSELMAPEECHLRWTLAPTCTDRHADVCKCICNCRHRNMHMYPSPHGKKKKEKRKCEIIHNLLIGPEFSSVLLVSWAVEIKCICTFSKIKVFCIH